MHFVDAKSILSSSCGMNVYRGCTHGCIYCDSRSLCYQFTHPFEDIEVKQNAPELLDAALAKKRRVCMIQTGAMSDPYMHCETSLRLTRRCLEVIDRRGFGASVLTKSDRILEDIDLFARINKRARAVLQMTLTTFDDRLCRIVEPRVCPTSKRLEVLGQFSRLGIDTAVWITPILPFLNDTEENLLGLLDGCRDAGVKAVLFPGAGVTLRDGDREYFYAALDANFPGLRERYEKTYGLAYEVMSPENDRLIRLFDDECKRLGLDGYTDFGKFFDFIAKMPGDAGEQLSFF